MGFGFNLLLVFVLVPLTGILLVVWFLFRKKTIGKTIGFIWLGILGIILFTGSLKWLTSKKELDKSDYYGTYIINRDYFKGEQADWQYNHFRFEITNKDSIFFQITEKEKIIKTYKGKIRTTNPQNYRSDRLIIEMEQPTFHIMSSNPTTYRSAWSFYLVFDSPKFFNVFFKKGRWKPIE